MEKEKEVKTALGALREMYNAIATGLMEDYTMSQERVLRICESAYFQTAKSHIAAVVGVKPEEISDYEFHRLLDGHYTEDKGYEPIPVKVSFKVL